MDGLVSMQVKAALRDGAKADELTTRWASEVQTTIERVE